MSNPTPIGNGCSLEDCYTNLFALTDICGIKWRKLSIEPEKTSIDPLEDPVLVSYAKCSQQDILCVWRKVRKQTESRSEHRSDDHPQLGKELWLFWYGEQPNVLESLLSPELKEVEYGSWERDILSYECRTLLFKAIHNLIERCLLSKNFIRLGRWFIKPFDPHNVSSDPSIYLSFSLNFFLHGESTVCASIEVKQHPMVMFLSNQHLNQVQETQTHMQVILAPYGLSGTLTGVGYRDGDPATRKILEDWKQFYPIKTEESKDNDPNKLPNLVEVIVAGVRMRYPSCYVLLCDTDNHLRGNPISMGLDRQLSAPQGHLTSSVEELGVMGDVGIKVGSAGTPGGRPLEATSRLQDRSGDVFSARMMECVSHDACITAGLSKKPNENMTEETIGSSWDFAEPSARVNCSCPRLRAQKTKGNLSSQGKGTGGKHQKGEKGLERQQSRFTRTNPFHRRPPGSDDFIPVDMEMFIPRVNQSGPNFGASNSSISQMNTSEAVNNIESPASNAPSPLEEPHNQPVVNQNMDPTMPTLSPHPPPKDGETKDITKQVSSESQSNNLMNGGDRVFPKPHTMPKTESVTSPYNSSANSWTSPQLDSKNANINSWLRTQQKQVEHRGLKRPSLPVYETDESELVTDTLYNFNSVQSWSDYPIKKICCDQKDYGSGIQDLSGSFPSSSTSASSLSGQSLKPSKPPTPQPPAPDPYEFSEEASINPAAISRAALRNSRDEMFHRPSFSKMEDEKIEMCRSNNESFNFPRDERSIDLGSLTSPPTTPGTQTGPSQVGMASSLTREKDLIPQVSDLDNLFESDSDSNDDPFSHNSPIMSKSVEDGKSSKTTAASGTGDVMDKLSAAELARMYPTPPSLENNHNLALSPATSAEAPVESVAHNTEGICIKTEVHICHVILEETTRDWANVYKPPKQAMFVSSVKYASVELPSGQLTPPPELPEYKPSWHFPIPIMEKHNPHTSTYINLPSIENIPSLSSRMPSSAIEASPATFQNSVGQQRTPMSYELQSPASNASSYLNKTLNSVDNHGTNNQMPEVHSLTVNIVLSDSILNLFKDHNFDSCNICVCNMNIKGADLGVYVPDPSGGTESQYQCTCGFSAVMNRKYGHNAGLFYEDEVDIMGIRDERFDSRKPSLASLDIQKQDGEGKTSSIEDVTHVVLELLIGQFTVPLPGCSSAKLHTKMVDRGTMFPTNPLGLMQLQDWNEVVYSALDQGRQAMEHCHPAKLEDSVMKTTCLHKWVFLQGVGQVPQNSMDGLRLLRTLQPILQDAIQNSRITRLWEHTYKLSGPLTWIDFHQLAGRGADENSEPQPIPYFLVGFDKDTVSVSPYALRYWDKNFLEPYGKQRDIAYVIVTPENDFIVNQVKTFFKELSTMYEFCRLGHHCPISEKLRDGILRIGKNIKQKIAEQEIDEWFKHIGDSPVAVRLRLYAQACQNLLGPFLAHNSPDKSWYESNSSQRSASSQKPSEGSGDSSLNNSAGGGDENKDGQQSGEGQRDSSSHDVDTDIGSECPAVVVYMIEPFTYGQEWDDLNRLAMIGMLRCYEQMVQTLPENLQNNVFLQVVPLRTILDAKESSTQVQLLKSIAFSVFTTCRWNMTHSVIGRSLTGFGPAAAAEKILKRKEAHKNNLKLHSPPFTLAPMKDKQSLLAEACGSKMEQSNILFCVYCLSEDQRWLLAVCTDDRGELFETCTINIEIPNRNRRKKASARKIGLGKLFEFIIGVISMTSLPCRLVIGRFGRLGHGELKGWSGLLRRENLQKVSKHMKEICKQCSYQANTEYPCVLSACLVSLEQQPSFNLMPESVKAEEKMSSNCPLQTPRDASTTHILVFPTSASASANVHPLQLDASGGIDIGTNNFDIGDEDGFDLLDLKMMNEDFGEGNNEDFSSLMDVCVSMTPPGSPRQGNTSNPGSPHIDNGRNSPSKVNGIAAASKSSVKDDPQDDPPNLLQQPLAMGYYISTAETGPLPRWFWSSCPENETAAVKCFKAALHIHCSSKGDDFMHTTQSKHTHPLDSSLTCDVLRFVLEKYNALSWLTFDPAKNDRQSCLPIHFAVLIQMYHAMSAFV